MEVKSEKLKIKSHVGMSWTKVRLSSLVAIKTGKLDANASSKDGLYPFFTCAKEPLKISSYSYDCECVLVAGNGDLNVKYYQGKFDAYQRTYIVECLDTDIINARYLFHFLDTYLEKLREQSIGGVIKYIKLENLTEAQIPLPPLANQKRIAEILDAADALRRKDQELLKKYDELAQVIFIDMFGDPVKNEKGWEVKTIKSTTNIITYGLTVRPKYIENGFPLISARELRNGFVNYTGAPKISYSDFSKLSKKCKPQKGDILFSKTGSIGLSAIVDGSQEFAITQNAARINFKNEFYETYFIYALLKQTSFINKCVSLVKGNAVKDLQLGDFSEIEIICPPIAKQIKFSEMSLKTNELIKNSKDNFIVSDDLFNSLIQKAFKGELVA